MALLVGTKLGPYEVLAPIGAGGMGEVYRARDTRLDRTVAVKVLPSHLSSNPAARQRFEREARSISSLNHPNICALYDVGNQDGTDYLVMEFLEGETLAERLRKGCLPVDQVLKCAVEICDGLERAHRGGVIHRDLKPGNIMLTKSGTKLMDFGLAKAASGSVSPSNALTASFASPAGTDPLTVKGTMMGTFQYMSPEQLEGKEADTRSDIFALGAVLYEMASGQRAFSGQSMASAITAILVFDPQPMSTVEPMIPPALDRIVHTCLAKMPEDRFQSVHDLKLQLRWLAEGGSQAGVPAIVAVRRKRREWLGWAAAALLLLVGGIGYYLLYLEHGRVLPITIRSSIEAPEKQTFSFTGDGGGPPAISPDGTQVVYAAVDSLGKQHLWLRSLNSLTSMLIAGTDDAMFPFWSFDSRRIGFFADGNLRVVDPSGGSALVVCPAPSGRGATWSKNGLILFSSTFRGGLSVVSSAGGTAKVVLDQKKTAFSSFRWPQFMPDGNHFVFLAVQHEKGPESSLFFASLDNLQPKLVMTATAGARFASGHLLFLRGTGLMAQAFDPSSGKLSGEPALVTDQVLWDGGIWRGVFDASTNGVLVSEHGSMAAATRLGWFDRTGKQFASIDVPTGYQTMSLSRDAKFLAVQGNPASDLWSYDLDRGVHTRLTFDSASHTLPAWSPDNKWVAYVSVKNNEGDVFRKPSDGTGAEEPLIVSSQTKVLCDWSPDGNYILFVQPAADNQGSEIWAMPLAGERKPFPLVQTPFNNAAAVFSPDGKWIAYTSDESGRSEVFVTSFPKPLGKWQASLEGGQTPQWNSSGKEIFFLSNNDNRIMSAQVSSKGNQFMVGKVQPYFRLTGTAQTFSWFQPAPGGDKFMAPAPTDDLQPALTLTLNWLSELNRD
jgi:eukaryotic-like serine/threonine-protein kinase